MHNFNEKKTIQNVTSPVKIFKIGFSICKISSTEYAAVTVDQDKHKATAIKWNISDGVAKVFYTIGDLYDKYSDIIRIDDNHVAIEVAGCDPSCTHVVNVHTGVAERKLTSIYDNILAESVFGFMRGNGEEGISTYDKNFNVVERVKIVIEHVYCLVELSKHVWAVYGNLQGFMDGTLLIYDRRTKKFVKPNVRLGEISRLVRIDNHRFAACDHENAITIFNEKGTCLTSMKYSGIWVNYGEYIENQGLLTLDGNGDMIMWNVDTGKRIKKIIVDAESRQFTACK
jgi:hypothetical protein